MKAATTNVSIIQSTEGTTLGVAGNNYRVIVTGEQSGGTYASFDMLVPPGGGPLPHAHPKMQEFFYVTEGELTFKTAAGHTKVGKGGFVHIPYDGGVHSFYNGSGEMARLLCTVMPAGLEEVFAVIGVPAKPGEFLPVPPMTDDLKAKIAVISERFEQKIYPPGYLD